MGVQSQPWLHKEFGSSLCNMTTYIKLEESKQTKQAGHGGKHSYKAKRQEIATSSRPCPDCMLSSSVS